MSTESAMAVPAAKKVKKPPGAAKPKDGGNAKDKGDGKGKPKAAKPKAKVKAANGAASNGDATSSASATIATAATATADDTIPVTKPGDVSKAARAAKMKDVPPRTPSESAEAAASWEKCRKAASLMKMVADPTRLTVVMILSDGPKHVGAICEGVGQSQPAVSHHLALLRHGGVIFPDRRGKQNHYDLTDRGRMLLGSIRRLCEAGD